MIDDQTLEADESGQLLRNGLATLSLGAAAIHFAVIAEHFDEYWLLGVFFVVTAWLQALWALAVVVRRERSLLLGGAFGNALIVFVWILSRTSGLPFGPEAGEAEAAGLADVVATAFESLIVLGAMRLVFRAPIRTPGRRWLRLGALAGALAVISLTSVSLALLGSAHGSHAEPPHEELLFRPLATPLGQNGEDVPVPGLGNIAITFDPYPPRARTGLTVLLADATGHRIEGAHVDLSYDMGMPHGPTTVTLQPRGDGVYEADLRFHMAGRWILSFGIEQDGERHLSDVELRIPFG